MDLKNKYVQITFILVVLIGIICYIVFLSTKTVEYDDIDKDGFLTIRIFADEEELKKMQENPELEEYIKVDVDINGKLIRNCGLRTKGSSTYKTIAKSSNPTKFGYRLEFDYYNKSQSYNGIKKVYVNNGIYDKTYIKEMIAFDIYEKAGVITPKRSLSEISINGKNYGIYTIVEIPEEDFLIRNYGENYGIIYKPKMTNETTPLNEKGFFVEGNEIEDYPSILKGEKFGKVVTKKDLENLTETLRVIKEEENIEEYVDITAVLDYLAVTFFIPNEDSFISESFRNFYIYQSGKKISILPFDMNLYLLYANSNNFPILYYDVYLNLQKNPLIYKLLSNEEYRAEYKVKIENLIEELEDDDWLEKRMDFYFSKVEQSAKNNSNNFYSAETFEKAKVAFKDIFASRIRSVKQQLEAGICNKQVNYEPQINSSLIGGIKY